MLKIIVECGKGFLFENVVKSVKNGVAKVFSNFQSETITWSAIDTDRIDNENCGDDITLIIARI